MSARNDKNGSFKFKKFEHKVKTNTQTVTPSRTRINERLLTQENELNSGDKIHVINESIDHSFDGNNTIKRSKNYR
jgi:hypothetical protein